MRFSLAWLLWLVTCAAIACWLVMLPPLLTQRVMATSFSIESYHDHFEYDEATHWPAEMTARLLLAVTLAIAPLLVKWRRQVGDTAR